MDRKVPNAGNLFPKRVEDLKKPLGIQQNSGASAAAHRVFVNAVRPTVYVEGLPKDVKLF